MVIRSLLAAFAALAAPFAAAKESAPAAKPIAAAPVAVEPASPALWKVADADTTIYLFGTVHALPPGIGWYRGKVAEAFESSQDLVTEIVETEPAEMQRMVISKALLPEGKTLRAELPEKQRADLEAVLAKHGLQPAAFDRFKPWYAAIALATLPLAQEKFDSENGVETLLNTKAKARGQRQLGLETGEYQLGLFDALPAQVQHKYLSEVIRTLPEVKDQLTAIIAAWKAGDADLLARLINEEEDDPAMREALLTNRNKNWADWVKTRLGTPGTVFLAVGAGHLAGDGSLQEQLKARGIQASRVQ